jgi:cobalt/nickel transport system permease protein
VKLAGLVAFLLVVAVTPPSRPLALALQGLIALAVAVAAYTPARSVLGRLTLDLPLVVLAVVYALFGHGPYVEILGLGLSRPGLTVGLAVLAKATIGIVAVSAVAASTSVAETVVGLRRLHVPRWYCDLLALVVRQVGLLREDLRRLQLATRVRAGNAGWRARWRVGTRSFGALFVRSAERLDRLQLALAARGGTAFGPALASTASPAPTSAASETSAAGRTSTPTAPTTATTAAAAAAPSTESSAPRSHTAGAQWLWAALPASAALMVRMVP